MIGLNCVDVHDFELVEYEWKTWSPLIVFFSSPLTSLQVLDAWATQTTEILSVPLFRRETTQAKEQG